jgi:hypothetical protein
METFQSSLSLSLEHSLFDGAHIETEKNTGVLRLLRGVQKRGMKTME